MILHTGQKQIFFERNNTEKKEIKEIFISESVVMKNIYNKIKDLAYENSSVLILGARGTGCKTVAQRIFNENKYNNILTSKL